MDNSIEELKKKELEYTKNLSECNELLIKAINIGDTEKIKKIIELNRKVIESLSSTNEKMEEILFIEEYNAEIIKREEQSKNNSPVNIKSGVIKILGGTNNV